MFPRGLDGFIRNIQLLFVYLGDVTVSKSSQKGSDENFLFIFFFWELIKDYNKKLNK